MAKSKNRKGKSGGSPARPISGRPVPVPPEFSLAGLGLTPGGSPGATGGRQVEEQDLRDAMAGRVAFSGAQFLPGATLNTAAHLYLDWILGRGDFAHLQKARRDQGTPASWGKLGGKVHLREEDLNDGDFFALSVRPLKNKLALRFLHVLHREDLGPCEALLQLPVYGKTQEAVEACLGGDEAGDASAAESLNKPGILTGLVTHHIGLVLTTDPELGSGVVVEHAVRYSPPPGLIAEGLSRLVYVPAPFRRASELYGTAHPQEPVVVATRKEFESFMLDMGQMGASSLILSPGGPIGTTESAVEFLRAIQRGFPGLCGACVIADSDGSIEVAQGLHFFPGRSSHGEEAPGITWNLNDLAKCISGDATPTEVGDAVWLEVMGGLSDLLDEHGPCVDRVEYVDQDRRAQDIEASWAKTTGGRALQERVSALTAEAHQTKKDLRAAKAKADEQEKILRRVENAYELAKEAHLARSKANEEELRQAARRQAGLETEMADLRSRANGATAILEEQGLLAVEHRRLVEAEAELKAEVDSLHGLLHVAEAERSDALEQAEALRKGLHALEMQLEAMGSRTLVVRGATEEDPARPARMEAVLKGEPTLEQGLLFLQEAFPERLVVLTSALASARESDKAGFLYRRRAFEMLKSLVLDYRDALAKGEGDAEGRKIFGRDGYAAKESETGDSNERMRRSRTYIYKGREVYMGRHLKLNYKTAVEETLRIHFHWDAEEQRIVLGHCGEHKWKLVS